MQPHGVTHSFHFISFHFISFHFISFHFISFHFISFHFISFISFHFISFHFISFHFISFHFISFHFISFHFISFHFISFHFISNDTLSTYGTYTHCVSRVPVHAVSQPSPFNLCVRSARAPFLLRLLLCLHAPSLSLSSLTSPRTVTCTSFSSVACGGQQWTVWALCVPGMEPAGFPVRTLRRSGGTFLSSLWRKLWRQ